MAKIERFDLVELVGPGGRCLVPKNEVADYLKYKGWARVDNRYKPLEKEQKQERAKLVGPVIPSAESVMEMTTAQLKRIITEFDLALDLNSKEIKYRRVAEKRRAVNLALEGLRNK